MDLLVKRKSDGKIFKVRKYITSEEEEEHIWSNDWYGHHIIGSDCEWAVVISITVGYTSSSRLINTKHSNYDKR